MTMTEIRRVLVVDDDPDIRTLLSMNLEFDGYQVAVAEDGFEAERLARKLLPDLIVLDVMMPGVDGIDVLQSLKTDPETCHIPVVMLTAKAGDDDVWAGWQAGADYYMTKPFDFEQLLRYIERLQGAGRSEAPA